MQWKVRTLSLFFKIRGPTLRARGPITNLVRQPSEGRARRQFWTVESQQVFDPFLFEGFQGGCSSLNLPTHFTGAHCRTLFLTEDREKFQPQKSERVKIASIPTKLRNLCERPEKLGDTLSNLDKRDDFYIFLHQISRFHLSHLLPLISLFVLVLNILISFYAPLHQTPQIIIYLAVDQSISAAKISACTHKIIFRVHALLMQAGVLIYQLFFIFLNLLSSYPTSSYSNFKLSSS